MRYLFAILCILFLIAQLLAIFFSAYYLYISLCTLHLLGLSSLSWIKTVREKISNDVLVVAWILPPFLWMKFTNEISKNSFNFPLSFLLFIFTIISYLAHIFYIVFLIGISASILSQPSVILSHPLIPLLVFLTWFIFPVNLSLALKFKKNRHLAKPR